MQVRLRFKDQTFQITCGRIQNKDGLVKLTNVLSNDAFMLEKFGKYDYSQNPDLFVDAHEFLTSILAVWP